MNTTEMHLCAGRVDTELGDEPAALLVGGDDPLSQRIGGGLKLLRAGGDQGGLLRGALAAGMAAVAVRRRGPTNALAFGDTEWSGPVLDTAEQVPAYLAERA